MSATKSIINIARRTSKGLLINWSANDSSAAFTMLINVNRENREHKTNAASLFMV